MSLTCIFCDIVTKRINAQIVHEGSHTLAFRDIHPQAPIHVLVIPKKHVPHVVDVRPEDAHWVQECFETIQHVVKQEGLSHSGFRLVINNGQAAGQAVDHFHWHILGGRKLSWPPG